MSHPSSRAKRRVRPAVGLLAALLLAGPPSAPPAAADGWVQLPNGPRAGFAGRHDDLDFIDADKGWVVNGDGDVWHTPDGGNSWTLLSYTGAYNRCVGFADSLNGWIGMLYQTANGEALLRTADGGHTWTPVTLPEPKPRGLCGLAVVNPTTVCAVGTYYGYPTFIRTRDAGATWSVKDMSAYCGALVDTHWFGPFAGVAVGSTAPGPNRHTRILTTADGGVTWTVRWTGTRNKEICWKISFVDRYVGFVSIENLDSTGASYFLKTLDGGLTWSEQLFSPGYLNCQGIGFVTPYYGWIGGWNIGTYITRNGGNHWTWKNFGYNVNRIRFLSPFLGYAVGRDVYKYQADPSGVGEAPPPAPIAQLEQNRPNPFRSSTLIPYVVNEAGPVSLRLFDLQGRVVREIYSGARAAGHYTAPLDAAGLAAGTYYYQLHSAAGSETRKLQIVR